MTSAMPDHALELARAALDVAPAGLLADLDGTLAPIIADPGGVRPVAGAREGLATLAGRLAVVGIVTGRAAGDARAIIGLDDLLVVGNHGLEWLAPGAPVAQVPEALSWAPAAVDRWLAAVRAAADDPGISLDAKGLSGTIHYRGAHDVAGARDRILAALGGAARDGLEVREGRMSVELRPLGAGDKGTAVRAVVDRYRLRGLVVAGDDVTDLDMFLAAAELRDTGHVQAAILAVGGAGEVPAAVAEAADVVLPTPAALAALLGVLATTR